MHRIGCKTKTVWKFTMGKVENVYQSQCERVYLNAFEVKQMGGWCLEAK